MTTRGEISELINAAYYVATDPTTVAYAKPYSTGKLVDRDRLRRLLEALEPVVSDDGRTELRRRIEALDRAAELQAARR